MKKIVLLALSLFINFTMQAQIDRSQQPKPGPAPKINIGKPQSFKLNNGLTVMVVENHKLPRVSATLTIDNAPFAEGNKAGLSSVTSSLMGNGTSKISKDAFNEEVEFYGASLSLYSGGGFASSLTKYFPRVLELMSLGAIDPLFTQEEFDKEIAKMIEGLKADEKSVTSTAARVTDALTYGSHPYGEYVTEETLKNISLADVKKHYANFFSPNNAYLIITGDIKFDEAKALVEKHFKAWKKGNSPVVKYSDPKDVQYTQINFVDMPNAVQSEISLINLHKLKMSDKDYFAVILANQILGGDFNSYLNMNLREAHGWTYGARSSISATRTISNFTASSSVRNSVTDSAVVEFLKEIKRIRTEKVDPQVLADVKAGFIGSFVMQMEKPQTVARYALNTILHKLPSNFYENFIKNINAVTVDDILRVSKKYFSYDNSRIVIVGKGSEVIPALEKLNIPIFYFDKFAKPTTKPEAKKVDANVSVKSIMDNYIKAVGGEKALNDVKTLMVTSKGSMQGVELTLVQKTTSSNKSFEALTGMGQTLSKRVFNGTTGYEEGQGQRMDLDADKIADSKYNSVPFPELKLASKPGLTVTGIENINGSDAYVVKDGNNSLYYDVKSGLKVAESTTIEAQGQSFTQMTTYGDYKEVKGVKIAHSIVMNVGIDLSFTVNEVKINEGVTDADFN